MVINILKLLYYYLKKYIEKNFKINNIFCYYGVNSNIFYTEKIFLFKLRTSNVKINNFYLDDLNKLNIKTILNFGSGDGISSEFLREKGFIVIDIDINNYSKTNIKPIIYDGKKIPFMDKSFDCVVCNFVLHHTDCSMIPNLIAEMKRVGNIILISEDLNMNSIDNVLCKFHLLIKNHWNSSENVKILSDAEWKIIFNELELKILKIYVINRLFSLIYPINRVVYILR